MGQAAGRSRPLSAARQAGFDRQAAGRRPDCAGRPGQGRDRRRPGDGQDGRAQRRLHPYRLADHRAGGLEARRSGQLSAALRRHRHRRHHPDRSDQRRVHDARGQSAAHLGAAQFRRQASGHGARPRQCPCAGDRDADHLRQPDRRDHRHDQDAGDIRQSERGPVPEPVRQRPPSGRHHDRRDARPQRGDPARRVGQFRLSPQRRFDGLQARRRHSDRATASTP